MTSKKLVCSLSCYFLQGTDSKQLSSVTPIKDDQIIISIPGDYSRKPPIGGNIVLI